MKYEYAIIVQGDEVRNSNGSLHTKKGTEFWVLREPEGWVDATSCHCEGRYGLPHSVDAPKDLLTFKTSDEAKAFALKWKGHPWWCVPISHRLVQVRAVTHSVVDGYRVVVK